MKSPTPIDKFLPGRRLKSIATIVFIDPVFWYKYWHCHRLPERSFSVSNRQFHICARCTGLVLGIALIPLFIVISEQFRPFFLVGVFIFFFDGLTQLAGLRKSTVLMRLLTGFFFPLSLLLVCLTLLA
jgi:uncharacterized membrane protein